MFEQFGGINGLLGFSFAINERLSWAIQSNVEKIRDSRENGKKEKRERAKWEKEGSGIWSVYLAFIVAACSFDVAGG